MALFSAQSDKLRGWSSLVFAIGGNLLDGFTADVLAILAPGVIRGRRLGGFDLVIQGLGVDHFSLANWLLVDGEGQGFAIVEDSDLSFSILADSHLGIAQGIVWAVGLDLVEGMVVLEGQVLGEGAGFLMGKDDLQVIGLAQRAVSIMSAAR